MRSHLLGVMVRSALVGFVAIAAASPLAHAQGGPGGGGGGPGGQGGGRGGMGMMMGGGRGGDMFGSPIATRDLDTFTKALALTPQQVETAKALVDGAAADYQPIAKAFRDKMEAVRQEFRDTQDPTVWQSLGKQMNESREARAKIETSFMGDLKAILTPEQQQNWPAAERTYRRSKSIDRGFMSGERVDLIRLVERAELPADVIASLKDVLEQYSVELDRELTKRNEVQEKAMDQGASLFTAFQNGDTTKAQELFQKGREAETRVRDVNRRYERQVESMLPEDQRAKFADAFKRESFPQVYRPTYASRVLDAAEKFTDLDDTQKSGLVAVRESFTREQTGLNTQYQAAIEETESKATLETMFNRGGGDPKMQELRTSRRTLDESTAQKVQDLLSEAQRAKLPERDARPDGGPGGPGGGRRGQDAGGNNGGGDNAQPQQQRRQRGQGRPAGNAGGGGRA